MTRPEFNADQVLEALYFDLPEDRIAQTGAEPRDSSRLMVVGAGETLTPLEKQVEHRVFHDLPQLLRRGDVLVFNESRVIPARIMARKPTLHGPGGQQQGGGQVEVLLLREEEHLIWSAYLKPAKRAGKELWLGNQRAEVVGVLPDGARLLKFQEDIKPHLEAIGRLPLPPYIQAGDHDEVWRERYQTVYARTPGSVAAPTAGLHFTPELLRTLDDLGVQRMNVTLHVGAGTFKPITGPVSEHVMHAEQYFVTSETAAAINQAKAEGRRVIAVGTTTVRTLESAWNGHEVEAGQGDTSIFITPGKPVHVPDLLITNLHLPGSTLLLLVAAFAGVERIKTAYTEALAHGYRFYSLGDAMLLENTSRGRV